jgi:hypothetical protein
VLVNHVCKSLYKEDIFRETTEFETLYKRTETEDALYKSIVKAIQEQKRTFLSILEVKVFIKEYSLNNEKKLLFREKTLGSRIRTTLYRTNSANL